EDELSKLNIDCSRVVKYISEDNRKTSPEIIVSWITEHELFHEGELALYIRSAGMKFPDCWITWGLR
ncbi:MAG: DinB family protein, partial [Thermoplasmatales archaeon]